MATLTPSRTVRIFGLGAVIVFLCVVLLQSFHVRPQDITQHSIQAINHLAAKSWRNHAPRIMKVTSLFGQENELYEGAIRSHEEHDRMNGYELKVSREMLVDSYVDKTARLLSLIVTELGKPVADRTDWLMWFGPDVILLNPQIPLDIFLPPNDFRNAHFLGTHDQDGLNCGVFFIRVHEWSVRMLIEVLATPKSHPSIAQAENKGQDALELVLRSDEFRGQVVYQPKPWYNAYQLSASEFEAGPGALLVHFHGLAGDKWIAMSETLKRQKSVAKSAWSVPLQQTVYEKEIREFWDLMRKAGHLMNLGQPRAQDAGVLEPLRRLQYAYTYEMDNAHVMNDAIEGVQDALGLPASERAS